MNTETGSKRLIDIIQNNEFQIPMYQRNYKWNIKTTTKLANDIVFCYEQSKPNTDVKKSLGLLTLYKKDEGKYDVIDGQQRFTTLAIFLSILGSEININLGFRRDDMNSPKRFNAIYEKAIESTDECTDVNRINRNKSAIEEIIKDFNEIKRKEIAKYILENVVMLCSIVNNPPLEEFMNLNAYKTAFSICDHIRSNLIILNSFHKQDLEKKDEILAKCLSNHSYKTAVAILYNSIQEKLYSPKDDEKDNKDDEKDSIDKNNIKYKGIYELLKEPIYPKPNNESHINILFNGMLDNNAKNYDSKEINENLDYWINMIQKLAYINKLLDELKSEMDQGEFHSFKQIDDYQNLTGKSFIRQVFDKINSFNKEETLAKEIQRYSNIKSVLIRCLNQNSKKLANRYLEGFVYSSINSETNKKADMENWKKNDLPHMKMDEVVSEINGCGRYIIDRYEKEHREDLNINIVIPPMLDLEDRENINFGGSLDKLKPTDDTISVGELFNYDIKIPVIQRDYCMGARITGKDDFFAFLLDGFKEGKELSASTILISVSNKNTNKEIYIFDGQQRTFTLYNILSNCDNDNKKILKSYSFIGRESENTYWGEYGSPYSKESVKQLNKIIKDKIPDNKKEFADYIRQKVFLKVKIVERVSSAEQFFMDINGGVALKKYEIYKAMLCNRLSDLGKEEIVRKIENEWLDFFYNYRKDYLEISNIQFDESDEEELLEIRFIEYVCRFVYRMNHYGAIYEDIWKYDQNSGKYIKLEDVKYGEKIEDETNLLTFDEVESKSEIVSKLGYINKLTENDINIISNIMDHITKSEYTYKGINKNDELVECNYDEKGTDGNLIYIDSKGKGFRIMNLCLKNGKKDTILNEKNKYISRFIWSLSDENRKYIKNYYKYKDISRIVELYDSDQIMRDILLEICNKNIVKGNTYYPYSIHSEYNIYIYGGYRNAGEKSIYYYINENQVPKGRIFRDIYIKEIPAYYWNNIKNFYTFNILRLHYIYEKAEKTSNNLYFALVENGIEHKDGSKSNVIQIKEAIEYHGQDRFKFLNETDWNGYFSMKSAYLFKYDALRHVNEYCNNREINKE